MTEVRAQRLICEAAALDDDKEAAALLRSVLDTLTVQNEAMGTLLIAYAWVDPEDALHRCQNPAWAGQSRQVAWDHYDWMTFVPYYVEQIREAHLLHHQESEAQVAYAAITALLSDSTQQHRIRLGAEKLAVALRSSEEFLKLQNWSVYTVYSLSNGSNVFLLARLWRDCPTLLWQEAQKLQKYVWESFWPVGQWVLSANYKPENLPLLLSITEQQARKPGGAYGGRELSAVFKTLEVLEAQAPQELRTILPMLWYWLCARI